MYQLPLILWQLSSFNCFVRSIKEHVWWCGLGYAPSLLKRAHLPVPWHWRSLLAESLAARTRKEVNWPTAALAARSWGGGVEQQVAVAASAWHGYIYIDRGHHLAAVLWNLIDLIETEYKAFYTHNISDMNVNCWFSSQHPEKYIGHPDDVDFVSEFW